MFGGSCQSPRNQRQWRPMRRRQGLKRGPVGGKVDQTLAQLRPPHSLLQFPPLSCVPTVLRTPPVRTSLSGSPFPADSSHLAARKHYEGPGYMSPACRCSSITQHACACGALDRGLSVGGNCCPFIPAAASLRLETALAILLPTCYCPAPNQRRPPHLPPDCPAAWDTVTPALPQAPGTPRPLLYLALLPSIHLLISCPLFHTGVSPAPCAQGATHRAPFPARGGTLLRTRASPPGPTASSQQPPRQGNLQRPLLTLPVLPAVHTHGWRTPHVPPAMSSPVSRPHPQVLCPRPHPRPRPRAALLLTKSCDHFPALRPFRTQCHVLRERS